MGWRTVVVESRSKVCYRGGYIVIKREKDVMVLLTELDVIVLESPQVSFTGAAMAELIKAKVKIIFCDERHNPVGEVVSYHDHYHTARQVQMQTHWSDQIKSDVATAILRQKVCNQAKLLHQIGQVDGAAMLWQYAQEMQPMDSTNREGHAAKVYFSLLYGQDFERHGNDNVNAALDYAYAIILSCVNRAVCANGYLPQLGIYHRNEFNPFNLSCDLMEVFRPIVDEYVFRHHPPAVLDTSYKHCLVGLINRQVTYDHHVLYLSDAIARYVQHVLFMLSNEDASRLVLYEF